MTHHKWTDAERDLVRRKYGKVPTAALAKHIGVPPKAVSLVASNLGVSIHPRSANHCWTEEEDGVLRREFQQTTDSAQRIAFKLELTVNQVKHRVAMLGLGKQTDRRAWTREEEQRLARLVEQGKTVPEIAKLLKRGCNSVKIRAKRELRLSLRVRNGWYTKGEARGILGIGHKWLQARIDSGALKARPHFPGDTPQKNGQHPWHITEAALRDFIRRHPHELNGRNVDLVVVVDILAGLVVAHETDSAESAAG